MTTFLTESTVDERVKTHDESGTPTIREFRVEEFRPYTIVTADIDPNVRMPFGRCPKTKEYFISEDTPEKVREAILAIAYYRAEQGLTHEKAVETRLTIQKRNKRLLMRTLLKQYEAFAGLHEEGPLTMESLDITATVAMLKKYQRRRVRV